MAQADDLALVVPAKNEQLSIAATMQDLARHVPGAKIFLVCDSESDPTIAAARAALAAGVNLQLSVLINPGAGVVAAIRQGIAAVDRPYCGFWMADGADRAETLAAAASKLRTNNADIVCASRFMPGGAMQNAPWLKGNLSRLANWTLRHIWGMPISDATNAFFVCKTSVLKSFPVESPAGFAFALEIKAKAHLAGLSLLEVPSQWQERRHGKSNFKIARWLPVYLRWYCLVAGHALRQRGRA